MAHHPLSMSNWPAWEVCPCKRPGGGDSAVAQSGSRSHAWLKYMIDCHVGEGTAEMPQGVTADEKARAEWAFYEASAILGSYSCEGEMKVKIEGHEELDGIEGTCDLSAVLPDRIVVIDYKTYSTRTDDLIAQPLGYALAIYSSGVFMPKEIEAVILHGGSHEVERVRMGVEEAFERAHRIVRGHLEHGDDLDRATPNHFCQYCPRLKECPATDRSLALVQSEAKFPALPLAQQLVVAKQVRTICDRVEKEVKRQLDEQIESGVGVEDAAVSGGGVTWKYKVKPGPESLADIVGLANEVAKHGIGTDGLMALAGIAKTRLCDALVTANPGLKVADAKRLVKPFYAPGKPSRWLERAE